MKSLTTAFPYDMFAADKSADVRPATISGHDGGQAETELAKPASSGACPEPARARRLAVKRRARSGFDPCSGAALHGVFDI